MTSAQPTKTGAMLAVRVWGLAANIHTLAVDGRGSFALVTAFVGWDGGADDGVFR